jgi:hypothetical protein
MVEKQRSGGKPRRIGPVTWALIALAATAIACACGGIQNQVERAMEEAASDITIEVPTIEVPTIEVPEIDLGEPTEVPGGVTPVEEEPTAEEPTEEVVTGGGTCDPRSAAIQPNVSVAGHIDATDQGYPDNCTYYCLWLPGGENGLDVTLSDFSVDLDLYVVYGEYDELQNPDPDSADWSSNEFGTTDEMVSISNPGTASAYYIEVCSYEGTASDFTLTTETR